MRSFLTIALGWTPVLALVVEPALEWTPEQQDEVTHVTVLEYNSDTAYTKFSLPCPGCFSDAGAAADDLVFELQVHPTQDIWTSNVVLNAHELDITWDEPLIESSQLLSVLDTSASAHRVNISWIGIVAPPPPSLFPEDDATQNIRFHATPLDGNAVHSIGFVAIMRPTAQHRLLRVSSDTTLETIDFDENGNFYISSPPSSDDASEEMQELHENDGFDLAAELQSLSLLQAQAHDLHIKIAAKKKAISDNVRQEREKLCLKHLIQKCDGILCAAKAVAQRVCDKIGVPTEPSFEYARMKYTLIQHEIPVNSKSDFRNHINNNIHSAHAASLPLILTKNGSMLTLHDFDLSDPPNALVRALQVIAALLGISALYALIKRKFTSMRTRVERAADREEARNARAYRRAARRALMRKRWDNFVHAVNCFRAPEPRIEDYEEKRALILQDAFLEQDLDQAEKGEVMEAEIRELRHAHEIVSSLVRVDEHRYALVTPLHDPPPPLVPLPYTPVTRSRASTGTLPPYTSDSLPDYTSRPSDAESSRSVGDGFTPPTSLEEESNPNDHANSETSSRAGYTPTSSILETSPRASEETLRTRQSRETQHR